MEIERKFLFKILPENYDSYPNKLLEQAYISTEPVIRVRKKITSENEAYILTVKSAGMLARQEFELDLEKTQYENLVKKVEGNVITKRRYVLPLTMLLSKEEASVNQGLDLSSLSLELDLFQNAFLGLVMGEIEFPDEETAKKFTPPAGFAEEVTYDKRFHNSNLSKMTESEILDLLTFVKG